ncbi:MULTISPECIES: PP0621 family protein [Pseudomonas]|uniref:Envelope stress response protein PspG n=1 Tax=Pseudomonas ekonensis TaxID=2842353 RepID=A0ABS6P809_9PSED|nr:MULTISPECIES: PP0621 family protein [Pseudomonas]MBV4456603.1 envelope stress response protein PspG [Pseudomonas ekonensis]
MLRLLFWIALIAAAVWLWRKIKAPASPAQSPREQDAAPMVRCAHCGVHLPRDRALSLEQQWYCSQAHLEQGPGSSGR